MSDLKTYAEMANKVYKVPNWSEASINGWETWTFGEGTENTTGGFHGCIYKKGGEVVVVFRGTKPTSGRDILADVRLAIGISPRQSSAARDLFQRAKAIFDGANIILVGHSLGGGLAQLVGHWYKVPFVTFNAPPMTGTIQKTKLNIFMPQKAWRSMKATFKDGVPGYNYRLVGDVVSSRVTSVLGHYGKVIDLPYSRTNPGEAHSMDTVEKALKNNPAWGNGNPF